MITRVQRPFVHHCAHPGTTCLRWLVRLLFVMLCLWLLSASSHSLQAAPALQTALASPSVANVELRNPQRLTNTNAAQTVNFVLGWFSSNDQEVFSVAWGDVDGDGDLDLAVGGADPTKIYLNEQGNLQTSAAWAAVDSDGANSIVAWGDVDGDGDLDLAVGGNFIKIYLNEHGRLQTSATWTAADSVDANCIAWGDVDGDGDLDFAVSSYSSPTRIYVNQDGRLEIAATWAAADSGGASSIAWGDVDSDGDLDLAVGGGYTVPNKVYLNQQGRLEITATWTAADIDASFDVAWGDVDGDGDLDLAVGGVGRNAVYLNEQGSLQTTPGWTPADSDNAFGIAWGDVDGDGDLDLAVGNSFSDHSYRFYLNQDGSLETTATWTSVDSDDTNSIAWGDVDVDGDLDLAVGSDTSLKIYLNQQGSLAITPSWTAADSDWAHSIAWGDVDGNGDLDLAVGGYGVTKVYLNQQGRLAMNPGWNAVHSDWANSIVAWGDVDGDGDLDLAVGSFGLHTKIYLNQQGSLQTTPGWTSADDDYASSLAWGDVDGDGDLDLAVAGGGTPTPTKVYLNQQGSLETTATWISADSDQTNSIAWGDVDGDGDLDLAVGKYSSPNKIYLNQYGSLEMTPIWISADSDQTNSIAWGDVDGDGDLDLAVGNGLSIKIYLNQQGSLAMTPSWTAADSDWASSIAWGDVDGDGDLDLAVGNGLSIKIYLNLRPAHLTAAHQTNPQFAISLQLVSDAVPTFNSQFSTALANAGFYAVPGIRQSGIIPITYNLFHPTSEPIGAVRAYYSLIGGFPENRTQWRIAKPVLDTQSTDLTTSPYPTTTVTNTHVFNWDVTNSGFFGQSDNVVVRIEALPNLKPVRNGVPGPFQRPYVSSQTFPFRVRGTQVRVLQAGNPAQPLRNAIVYRLAANQTRDAQLLQDQRGVAFQTNGQGYLQGYGSLQTGDQLVALLPITHTASYTLYQTSATPALSGLDAYTVNSLGVQTLTVSAANPLLLFNLTVSLEWDTRNDPTFMTQLQNDLKRTSQILFDVSNGQAALGHVRIYHDKGFWGTANLVILANNGQRPNAVMGGSVPTATVDVDSQGNPITDAYVPGQVRIGATWNRFGNADSTLGEDWPRALAHELGHFFFFQADDYIGVSPDHKTIKLVDCKGSIMTDPYDENYSEFVNPAGWTGDCLNTLTQQYMGRSDWQTIKRFYPMLNADRVNPGPSQLPLAVTNIEIFAPPTPTNTLAAPFFNLVDSQNKTITLEAGRGQGYLFKTQGDSDPTNDYLIALGAPVGDLVQARGAAAGDRLCVFDVDHTPLRIGCLDAVGSNPSPVVLQEVPNWQPQIQVRGVTSNTVAVTVTNSSAGNLMVQLLPALGVASPEMAMTANGNTFVQTVTAADGAYFGFVRVWVPGSNPRQELILEYTASEAWDARARAWGPPTEAWGARARAWGVPAYAWGARARAWGAPVMSSDGQVSIFPLDNPFAAGQRYTLQTIAFPPTLPSWLTAVGQTYRVSALAPTADSAIIFSYLARDVPAGYENDLRIYYSPDEGHAWQRLATDLDTYRNQASAAAPGAGIYILVATTEVRPAFTPGWNSFGYPVQGARPTANALAAIDGSYSTVYAYDPSAQRWVMFAPNVPAPFNDPVNTLYTLEYAHSYWVYATQPVTLYLGVGGASSAIASSDVVDALAADAPLAPATYYGWITPSAGFTPTVGMRVIGEIDGVACGETNIQLLDGKLAYILQVPASDPTTASLPCGARDKDIVFHVDHWLMDHNHVWDNSDAWGQPLNVVRQDNTTMIKAVYLPFIQR